MAKILVRLPTADAERLSRMAEDQEVTQEEIIIASVHSDFPVSPFSFCLDMLEEDQ